MRKLLVLLLLATGTPAAATDRPAGGFDRAHCLRAGKVAGPQKDGRLTCCYDDGCWICGEGWQGCTWTPGSAPLDLRGGMAAPPAAALPGASGRSMPPAMQGAGTAGPAPVPR
ncbi:MAG: hypothetical protein AB1689_20440 [Thermodesulfobacteriota bacterium]